MPLASDISTPGRPISIPVFIYTFQWIQYTDKNMDDYYTSEATRQK